MAPCERDWLPSATWAQPEAICSPAVWICVTSSPRSAAELLQGAAHDVLPVPGGDGEGEVAGGQLLQRADHLLLQGVGETVHGIGHLADFVLAPRCRRCPKPAIFQLQHHCLDPGDRPPDQHAEEKIDADGGGGEAAEAGQDRQWRRFAATPHGKRAAMASSALAQVVQTETGIQNPRMVPDSAASWHSRQLCLKRRRAHHKQGVGRLDLHQLVAGAGRLGHQFRLEDLPLEFGPVDEIDLAGRIGQADLLDLRNLPKVDEGGPGTDPFPRAASSPASRSPG